MKYVYVISGIFTAMLLFSCERDDICTTEIKTPRLVISFYDNEQPDMIKNVDTLSVWAPGKEKLYDRQKVDSILLPLNPATTGLQYILQSGNKTDTLYLQYHPQEKYISRSCGFIYTFLLQEGTHTSTSWIKNTDISTPQPIDNEQTHLKIYH